jgi:molecular chaperone DnaK/molecular chaperone HscA
MKGQTMDSAGEQMGAGLGAAPSAPHAFAPAQVDAGKPNVLKRDEDDPEIPGQSTED